MYLTIRFSYGSGNRKPLLANPIPNLIALYNHFQLVRKYLLYYFSASNGKGHGVHSPFVFDFIKNVLSDKKIYACYSKIEQRRKELLANNVLIEVEDFGAGSSLIASSSRKVNAIAASSVKSKKYGQLLFRMIQYYQPSSLLELGTSLGITSSYLSQGNPSAKLITCEGASKIAAIAQQTFDTMGLDNIEIIEGDFTKTLPLLFSRMKTVGFAFVDGNHRKSSTIQYFQQLVDHSLPNSIFVMDDIHWSSEMEEAWSCIQQNPAVTLTIDLFFMGVVFINPTIKVKQHFTIRF
jgi:predicted O-methyltransferase YrrM